MYPSVSSSSVITSRRMVVLPEPLGPMSVTRSSLAIWKLRSLSTVLSPNRLTTFSNRMTGVSVAGKAVLQFPDEDRRGVAGGEEDEAGQGEGLDVEEGPRSVVLRGPDHLRDEDDEQERGVLEHQSHPGPQRGHGDGLGRGELRIADLRLRRG